MNNDKNTLDGTATGMIEHHIKYKELHGVDETKWMTRSEHRKLHIRLRKEGKCNVPPAELNKISIAAYQRTDKGKAAHKRRQSKRLDNIMNEYFNSLKMEV